MATSMCELDIPNEGEMVLVSYFTETGLQPIRGTVVKQYSGNDTYGFVVRTQKSILWRVYGESEDERPSIQVRKNQSWQEKKVTDAEITVREIND